jgi:hypothetical protein
MNELSYLDSDEHRVSFEFSIDGRSIGDIVGPPSYGPVPAWLLNGSLPRLQSERETDLSLTVFAVCRCGQLECGDTACRAVAVDDVVILTEFETDGIARTDGLEFRVSKTQYDQVVREVIENSKATTPA